jgi:hypothetical protein
MVARDAARQPPEREHKREAGDCWRTAELKMFVRNLSGDCVKLRNRSSRTARSNALILLGLHDDRSPPPSAEKCC